MHNGIASVEGGGFLEQFWQRMCGLSRAGELSVCHSDVTVGSAAQAGTSSLQLCRGSSSGLSCQLILPTPVLTGDFYLCGQSRGEYIWKETQSQTHAQLLEVVCNV